MQQQGSFLQAEYARKKKPTRRDKFLAEMEAVVPWARLVQRLQPLYPKGLEAVFRIPERASLQPGICTRPGAGTG